MSFIVYRMYDADEALLYVGRSTRGLDRIEEHRFKEWWNDVDIVTIEHFATREASGAAEREAVASEAPMYNRAGVTKPGEGAPLSPVRNDAGSRSVARGEILRALRLKAGLSIAAFAREVGTVPSHISNIEAGRRGANPALVKRMAEVLNVPKSVLEVRIEAA